MSQSFKWGQEVVVKKLPDRYKPFKHRLGQHGKIVEVIREGRPPSYVVKLTIGTRLHLYGSHLSSEQSSARLGT